MNEPEPLPSLSPQKENPRPIEDWTQLGHSFAGSGPTPRRLDLIYGSNH